MSELGELSADAKSLVDLGRHADAPSASDRQRVKSRLAAQLGAGAFVVAAASSALPAASPGAPPQAAASTALRGLWKPGLLKAAAAAGAVGALYFGALTLAPGTTRSAARTPMAAARTAPDHPPQAALPQVPAPSASRSDPGAAPTRSVVDEAATDTNADLRSPRSHTDLRAPRSHTARASAVSTRRAPEPTADDARASQTPSTLAAELTLLAAAQRALREHQPQRALELAQQHAARFGSGSLGEERRGIEALAHCQLGEPSHASVASFLQRAPSSPLAARVRKECAPR